MKKSKTLAFLLQKLDAKVADDRWLKKSSKLPLHHGVITIYPERSTTPNIESSPLLFSFRYKKNTYDAYLLLCLSIYKRRSKTHFH